MQSENAFTPSFLKWDWIIISFRKFTSTRLCNQPIPVEIGFTHFGTSIKSQWIL